MMPLSPTRLSCPTHRRWDTTLTVAGRGSKCHPVAVPNMLPKDAKSVYMGMFSTPYMYGFCVVLTCLDEGIASGAGAMFGNGGDTGTGDSSQHLATT